MSAAGISAAGMLTARISAAWLLAEPLAALSVAGPVAAPARILGSVVTGVGALGWVGHDSTANAPRSSRLEVMTTSPACG